MHTPNSDFSSIEKLAVNINNNSEEVRDRSVDSLLMKIDLEIISLEQITLNYHFIIAKILEALNDHGLSLNQKQFKSRINILYRFKKTQNGISLLEKYGVFTFLNEMRGFCFSSNLDHLSFTINEFLEEEPQDIKLSKQNINQIQGVSLYQKSLLKTPFSRIIDNVTFDFDISYILRTSKGTPELSDSDRNILLSLNSEIKIRKKGIEVSLGSSIIEKILFILQDFPFEVFTGQFYELFFEILKLISDSQDHLIGVSILTKLINSISYSMEIGFRLNEQLSSRVYSTFENKNKVFPIYNIDNDIKKLGQFEKFSTSSLINLLLRAPSMLVSEEKSISSLLETYSNFVLQLGLIPGCSDDKINLSKIFISVFDYYIGLYPSIPLMFGVFLKSLLIASKQLFSESVNEYSQKNKNIEKFIRFYFQNLKSRNELNECLNFFKETFYYNSIIKEYTELFDKANILSNILIDPNEMISISYLIPIAQKINRTIYGLCITNLSFNNYILIYLKLQKEFSFNKSPDSQITEFLKSFEEMIKIHIESSHDVSREITIKLIRSIFEILSTGDKEIIECFTKPIIVKNIIIQLIKWAIRNTPDDTVIKSIIDILTILLTRTVMEVESIEIIMFLTQFQEKFGTANSLLNMLKVKSNTVKTKILFINIISKDSSMASMSFWNLTSPTNPMPPMISSRHPFEEIIDNSKSSGFNLKSDIELLINTIKFPVRSPSEQDLSDMAEILKQVLEPVLSNELKSRAVNLLLEFILKNRTYIEIKILAGQLLMVCLTKLKSESDLTFSYSLLKTMIAIILYYNFNKELKRTIIEELKTEMDKGANGMFGTIAKSIYMSECDQKYKLMFLQLIQITITLSFDSDHNNSSLPESPSHPLLLPMNSNIFLNPCQSKLLNSNTHQSDKLILMDLIQESSNLHLILQTNENCKYSSLKSLEEALNEQTIKKKLTMLDTVIPTIIDNFEKHKKIEIEKLLNLAMRFISKSLMSENNNTILSNMPLRIYTSFINKNKEIVKLFSENLTLMIQNLILKIGVHNEDSNILVAQSIRTFLEINPFTKVDFLYFEYSSRTNYFSNSHSKHVLKEFVKNKNILNFISSKEIFSLISLLLKNGVYSTISFNDSSKYKMILETVVLCLRQTDSVEILIGNHMDIFQTIKNSINSRIVNIQCLSISCLISIVLNITLPCLVSFVFEIGFRTIELSGQFNQIEPIVREQLLVLLNTILIRLNQTRELSTNLMVAVLDLFKRITCFDISPLMISIMINSVSLLSNSYLGHQSEVNLLKDLLLNLSRKRLKTFVRALPNQQRDNCLNKKDSKSTVELFLQSSSEHDMSFSISQFEDCFKEYTLKETLEDKESMESNREWTHGIKLPNMITAQFVKSSFYSDLINKERSNPILSSSIEFWKTKFNNSLNYSVSNWINLLQVYLLSISINSSFFKNIENEDLLIDSLEFLSSDFFKTENENHNPVLNQTIESIISLIPQIVDFKDKIVVVSLGKFLQSKNKYFDIVHSVLKTILFLIWKISKDGSDSCIVDEIIVENKSLSSVLFDFITADIGKTCESFKEFLIKLSQLLRCSNNARMLFIKSDCLKNIYQMILQFKKEVPLICIFTGILSSILTIDSQCSIGITPGSKMQSFELSQDNCSILITLLKLIGNYSEETMDRLTVNWILHPHLRSYIEEAIRKEKVVGFSRLIEIVCRTKNLKETETLYSLNIMAQCAVSEKISVYFNKKKIPAMLLGILFNLFESDKKDTFIQSNIRASEKVIELFKIMSFHPIANLNLLEDHSYIHKILIRIWELSNSETQENIEILFSNLLAGKTYKSAFVDCDRFLVKLTKDIFLSKSPNDYFRLIQLLYNLVFKEASVLIKLPREELKRCLIGIEVELEGFSKNTDDVTPQIKNTLKNTVNIRRLLQIK